jgi:hypothetical protein
MRCRTAHTALIAARDGELGARRRRALDRHLARCGACRAEQVAVDGVLAVLDRLPLDADVPTRLEHDVMRRVRALATESDVRGTTVSRWLRALTPPLAVGAVIAGAILGVRGTIDRTPTVQPATPVVVATRTERTGPARTEGTSAGRRVKTRIPDEPPPELASRPELFVDLSMLRDMEKLQHFDTIATMDDDRTDAVTPPSNG